MSVPVLAIKNTNQLPAMNLPPPGSLAVASIIIPSFNCSSWLERAVKSAYNLGSQPVEVIVIDDGSTDNTPALCATLKLQYPNLNVIRQPNGGLSAARNTGIKAATGTFIVLLDADDELIPFDLTALATFDGDVLRIGVEEVAVEGQLRHWRELTTKLPGSAYLQQHLAANTLYVPSWAYVYRRTFLQENQLWFTHGLIHEDMLFTIEALLKAKAVRSTEDLLYRYFRREGSITLQHSFAASKRRVSSLGRIVNSIIDLGNQNPNVDLWRWAAHVTDYAWSFVQAARSRKLAWQVLRMEWGIYIRYRHWGIYRTRGDVRWRLRKGLSRLVKNF